MKALIELMESLAHFSAGFLSGLLLLVNIYASYFIMLAFILYQALDYLSSGEPAGIELVEYVLGYALGLITFITASVLLF